MTEEDESRLEEQQRAQLMLDYQQTTTFINTLNSTRLVPLTLLPGLTAAAISVFTRFDNPRTAIVLGLIGLFASFGLIFHDIQNTAQHSAAVYRAKALERSLKLPAFAKDKQAGGLFNENPNRIVLTEPTSYKKPLVMRHKHFISVIYGVVIGGWAHVIVHSSTRSLPSGWQPPDVAIDLISLVVAVAVAAVTIRRLSRVIEHNEPE